MASKLPRLSAEPLVELHGLGLRSLAKRLGVNAAVLCRPLTVHQADVYAVRMGWHPLLVFSANDYYADLPDDELDDDQLVDEV